MFLVKFSCSCIIGFEGLEPIESNAQNPKTLTHFISSPTIPKPQSNKDWGYVPFDSKLKM